MNTPNNPNNAGGLLVKDLIELALRYHRDKPDPYTPASLQELGNMLVWVGDRTKTPVSKLTPQKIEELSALLAGFSSNTKQGERSRRALKGVKEAYDSYYKIEPMLERDDSALIGVDDIMGLPDPPQPMSNVVVETTPVVKLPVVIKTGTKVVIEVTATD